MFSIAYTFKGKVHVFEGRVKTVSHSSCRTSAILKYFCPLGHVAENEAYNNEFALFDMVLLFFSGWELKKKQRIHQF